MIKNLLIKNYALIQELKMNPSPNFNTITGETGAGKSIMLGAVGLLLGNRADTKVLFSQEEKCVIEGMFEISKQNLKDIFDQYDLDYLDEAIIRREISTSGKSRAFINDTPVTLDVMKKIGNFLVDVHSQRDTYLLGSASYQLRMIDGFAQNSKLIVSYRNIYKDFKNQDSQYNILKNQAEGLNREADYNHFLLDELDKATLSEGEQESLEAELKIIENSEEIKSKLFECLELLDNSEFAINGGMQQVLKKISQLSAISTNFNKLNSRLESCFHELKDIAGEIDSEIHNVEFDKERQGEVQERLGLLFQLFQKHNVNSESELIEIKNNLQQKVDRVSNLDDDLFKSKEELDFLKNDLILIGNKLTKSRVIVFDKFKKDLEKLLKELAMPHASIKIKHEEISPTENGMDKISILFSANIGIPPNELKNVASGGEFSRLMFCVKFLLAEKTSLPTIIFDEIDSGISGEIAMKMVSMMKMMATQHQVIAITHLPQIAASGDDHYFVFKENSKGKSISKIKKLDSFEREDEIAKMIGGDNPSSAALENARELLDR